LMREVERLTYVDGRSRVEKGNENYIQSIRVVLPGQPELETTGGGSRVSTT